MKTILNKTGIEVSRICFGGLTVGPLQANLPVEQGAAVMAYAIEQGISFFDTAQLYKTYSYIRRAMEISRKHDIVICSKTYAWTRQLAEEAVEQARCELNRDYIDIFMLHEQESEHTLRGHREALEYLMECKQKGILRAVGVSMHHIAAVRAATQLGVDAIHPLLNRAGLGIVDGTREEMETAVQEAHNSGIGIFLMKALGGGNLFHSAEDCLKYAFGLDYVDSVAIGMQSEQEVDANIEFFENGKFSSAQKALLADKKRHLHIDDWCTGCASCVGVCGQKALSVQNARAICDHSRCVLCGYCSAACPEWAIKVV